MAFEFISMWKYDLRYEIFELQMWSWNELKCISRHDLIFFLNSKIWPNEDFPQFPRLNCDGNLKTKKSDLLQYDSMHASDLVSL